MLFAIGRAGWGISWYINGTLIPQLIVERGRTYTFIIEGGNDTTDLSNYHPFYISLTPLVEGDYRILKSKEL